MKRLTLTLGPLTLAAVLAACSGASAAPESTTTPAGGPRDAVTIVARDLRFVQTNVSVKAGTAFAIVFDNKEGAPHNVAVSDASGASVLRGEIVSSKQVTYQVPALAAGTYPFACEVHPDMKGTITAQ